MTYAPNDLIQDQHYLFNVLRLPWDALGIVGDPAHASTGGYHEGNDDLSRVGRLTTDYSKRESSRDRPGTNAASALDVGLFDVTVNGRRVTLRSFSAALVAACRAGDPRTRDIREVIWSPDGVNVQRWDRLGIRSTGDSTHTFHTHTSFHRDSEGRRHLADNFGGLVQELIEGDPDMAFTDQDHGWLAHVVEVLGALESGEPVMWTKKSVKAVEQLNAMSATLLDLQAPTVTDAQAVIIGDRIATVLGSQLSALDAKLSRLLTAMGQAGDATAVLND